MEGLYARKMAARLAVYAAITRITNIHQKDARTRPAIDLGAAV
jgi:hypothetical protein